ncbi:hypothetical protein Q9L58_009346 [Maublancomyces gigas]|uniref:Uncharacterized protein n=1 Tax=Discina gigas TaxID=1032678 RepID=A0ABR3G738_9PEZI
MEILKIKQPREKLNARPLAVWILLGVTMEERANILDVIQNVYDEHRLGSQDTGFTRIPKHFLAKARSDLIRKLPLVFDRCETDWFADWALNRRHLKRNRKKPVALRRQRSEVSPSETFNVQPLSGDRAGSRGDTGMSDDCP